MTTPHHDAIRVHKIIRQPASPLVCGHCGIETRDVWHWSDMTAPLVCSDCERLRSLTGGWGADEGDTGAAEITKAAAELERNPATRRALLAFHERKKQAGARLTTLAEGLGGEAVAGGPVLPASAVSALMAAVQALTDRVDRMSANEGPKRKPHRGRKDAAPAPRRRVATGRNAVPPAGDLGDTGDE